MASSSIQMTGVPKARVPALTISRQKIAATSRPASQESIVAIASLTRVSQPVRTGASDNLSAIESTLNERVGEFRVAVDAVSADAGETSERMSTQVKLLEDMSTKVLADIGDMAGRFDAQGKALAATANRLDQTNAEMDAAIEARRSRLEELATSLTARAREIDGLITGYTNAIARTPGAAEARAGNRGVTPEGMGQELELTRDEADRLHAAELGEQRQHLSLSERRVKIPGELRESIEADLAAFPGLLDEHTLRHLTFEPFRIKIHAMLAKLATLSTDTPAYDTDAYLADLDLLARSLTAAGLGALSSEGMLEALTIRARTFGFHLASLDVRQHSERHELAVDELFRLAGVHPAYRSLDEAARVDVLRAELAHPRPLVSPETVLQEHAADALETFRVMRDAVRRDPFISLGIPLAIGSLLGISLLP